MSEDRALRPRLSACLIVKNEARHLASCLRAIGSLVDELIVVDTGSEDETVAIAERHGAIVERFGWVDDFAAARNFAASHAHGDWILSIDADEIIDPADHGALLCAIREAPADVFAFDLRQITYTDERHLLNWHPVDVRLSPFAAGVGGYIPMVMQRLYRRRPDVRFEGRVHELVGPSVERAGGRIASCEVPIHHYGRLDLAHYTDKARYYVELGEKKRAEAPDCARTYLELGTQLGELGEHDRAIDALEAGLAVSPDHPGLGLALAGYLMGRGEVDRAVDLCERRLALIPDCSASHTILGAAALTRGELETAQRHYLHALRSAPRHLGARIGLAGSLAQGGNLVAALDQLDIAHAEGAKTLPVTLMRGKLLVALDRPTEAVEALEDARRMGEQTSELHEQLALAHMRAGNPERAATHLRRAKSLARRSPAA